MDTCKAVPAREDWVTWHQSTNVLEGYYAKVVVNSDMEMSSTYGEYAYNIVSMQLTDEIDPFFLSLPIPSGSVTFSFADDNFSESEFYDNVLQRFDRGMYVETYYGFGQNFASADTIHRIGYLVTDIMVDVPLRQITLSFEHELTTLAGVDFFPDWVDGSDIASVLSTISRMLPNTNFDYLANVMGATKPPLPDSTVLQMLTMIANTIPFKFMFDATGYLTAYSGGIVPLQPNVSLWESECFNQGLVKENIDFGLEKSPMATASYTNKVDEQPKTLAENQQLYEQINYIDVSSIAGARAISALHIVYPSDYIIDNDHPGTPLFAQQLGCVGTTAGRIITLPCIPEQTSDGEGANYNNLIVHIESYENTIKPFTKQGIEEVNNPFGANIEACWTYPKNNFRFYLSGSMRDNPSFMPGQKIKVPYSNFWAEMMFVKTAHSFTGGGTLTFKGVVTAITDQPLRDVSLERAYWND